ncbi:unnamed protein product, partial [Iphiclides podalirius]
MVELFQNVRGGAGGRARWGGFGFKFGRVTGRAGARAAFPSAPRFARFPRPRVPLAPAGVIRHRPVRPNLGSTEPPELLRYWQPIIDWRPNTHRHFHRACQFADNERLTRTLIDYNVSMKSPKRLPTVSVKYCYDSDLEWAHCLHSHRPVFTNCISL